MLAYLLEHIRVLCRYYKVCTRFDFFAQYIKSKCLPAFFVDNTNRYVKGGFRLMLSRTSNSHTYVVGLLLSCVEDHPTSITDLVLIVLCFLISVSYSVQCSENEMVVEVMKSPAFTSLHLEHLKHYPGNFE